MIGLPHWATRLVRMLAPAREVDAVLGDLEEVHQRQTRRHGRLAAHVLIAAEVIEMTAALLRARVMWFRIRSRTIVQDYKLGLRMLAKYPGLTVAGGLALAIAIGIGAGWYELTRDLMRPDIPLPEGDRLVEIEMRNSLVSGDEQRLLHDFTIWRRDLRLVNDLSAYRALERNLIFGDARPEPVSVAETTASTFRLVRVPPLLGRPLLEADERPGAPPVVVLGHSVWQRQFGGRADIIGATIQLGRVTTTIVGVMPAGFAFPVNHRMWVPLPLRASGYSPLEGPAIRVIARLAPGATQEQAYAEVTTVAERAAESSPQTHEHLRPRVLAYGGESPGDRSVFELILTHLPTFLVLLVACMNVGTLIYARTATREAEIATRYALGAGRWRIVSQLFVEALVFASVAAVVGLTAAHFALKWGVTAYFAARPGGAPFWIDPGLTLTTMLYAALLTIGSAAILGVLPALKVTGSHVQSQLRTLGTGGATLRFGKFWTTAMITQVALTVVLLPPAMGISEEAWRDRVIRARFPTEQYLAVRVDFDREMTASGETESDAAFAARFQRTYEELERRIAKEPGVAAVTFADRLPGMGVAVQSAEVDVAPAAAPVRIENLWKTAVGPRFFESFSVPVVAGRAFSDRDRVTGAQTVLVNQAFARRYTGGASPVGRRVRYASVDPTRPQPWMEIVGMVGDIGMTPTDLGEAPYIFRAISPAAATPLVMAVRIPGDPASFAPRVRAIAADLDPGLRLDEIRRLDDLTWNVDIPMMVAAGGIVAIVGLGLFLSAAGIFALVSVSVARRTREIGLRAALGATRARVLTDVFARAMLLIGSGIAVGNLVLLLFVALSDEIAVAEFDDALLMTSTVMLGVGLLACIEPARRALRIQPTDALRDA